MLFHLFSKLQRVYLQASRNTSMEPHGKPATQQPEAIIVPKVPLDGELRGHAPSAAQAGFNSVWGGLKCQLFRITTRPAPFQSVGLERPQEGPGRKELCLWCPQPPAGSPRWEMRSQKHGPSQETDNREHRSGNTYFKGEFPSNINPTVRVKSLGFKSSNTDSILNGLSLNSCNQNSSPGFLPGPCPRLLIQQKT